MRRISATEAKQRLAAVIDAAQREPVIIRRQNRDVAVVLSMQDYERMRGERVAEFLDYTDQIARRAKARGLTEAKLAKLLKDDG
jgi:prevent-host-death family protein